MSKCIIACRTLEKELLAAMAKTGCCDPVYWLEAGQHNRKDARRAEIQAVLDACTDCDTVLLAMTLCGGCVAGLQSHNFKLVLPRCDDCITLLLGSQENRKNYPGTYFLTEGWLAGSEQIGAEYQRTLEKYGQGRANRIFSGMLANYEKMAFVDTGCSDASEQIETIAETLNLTYTQISGTISWLEELLQGSWDEFRFLVLAPNSTLGEAMCLPPHRVTLMPEKRVILAPHGTNLLRLLRTQGAAPDAPCGGNGTCGKCRVWVDGEEVSACQTEITRDMTVTLPTQNVLDILKTGVGKTGKLDSIRPGHLLAVDIGTTTVVCYLLSAETGAELAAAGAANPQSIYGADVISRIRAALSGNLGALTDMIRECLTDLIKEVCNKADISPNQIGVVSVVGNPAMQQLFLGICPQNLAAIPFDPVLKEAKAEPCGAYLPVCPNALLLTVPDISGYVGADTVGCVLATDLSQSEKIKLLVDIGTNGELVLGNKDRLIACATAAGPALEGAHIHFGMRGCDGAIDHVWLEEGKIKYSVIGGGKATGICGSGMIDTIAVALELGLLNKRGRILNEERIIPLTEDIYLTQEDIRQVQMSKGAIHAGICLMAQAFQIELNDITQVLLAGAFGSHLNPKNACRIGLLPAELAGRITAVGNAAGTGAKILVRDKSALPASQALAKQIDFLELASLPEFPRTFAKSMNFTE